jgi:hypothetical protein
MKITAFLDRDEGILPGEFESVQHLLNEVGGILDANHMSEAFPRVHFLADDGKVYQLTIEGVMTEAHPEIVSEIIETYEPDESIGPQAMERIKAWLERPETERPVRWKIDEAEDLPLAIIEDTEEGSGVCEIGAHNQPRKAASPAQWATARMIVEDHNKNIR